MMNEFKRSYTYDDNNYFTRQQGFALVELILVILIGSFLLMLGLRSYQTYRFNAEVMQVQQNVDEIAQAMNLYYHLACGQKVDANLKPLPGNLNPTLQTQMTVIEDISDLRRTGILARPLIKTSIVDVNSGTEGYFAQYSRSTSTREICTSTNCATKVDGGNVVTWNFTIAIALADSSKAQDYLPILNATCLSTVKNSKITPCAASGNAGSFLVWEKSSADIDAQTKSPYSDFKGSVAQFKLMYNKYSDVSLTSGAQTSNQYYLCGK